MGVVSSFEVATIDQIHRLITDRGLNPRARAELVARSVEVIIAPTEPDLDSRDRPRD